MNERGGFFWFDPFGEAPADAEVSGCAGGPIAWGGTLSWPFEQRESERFKARLHKALPVRAQPALQIRLHKTMRVGSHEEMCVRAHPACAMFRQPGVVKFGHVEVSWFVKMRRRGRCR